MKLYDGVSSVGTIPLSPDKWLYSANITIICHLTRWRLSHATRRDFAQSVVSLCPRYGTVNKVFAYNLSCCIAFILFLYANLPHFHVQTLISLSLYINSHLHRLCLSSLHILLSFPPHLFSYFFTPTDWFQAICTSFLQLQITLFLYF